MQRIDTLLSPTYGGLPPQFALVTRTLFKICPLQGRTSFLNGQLYPSKPFYFLTKLFISLAKATSLITAAAHHLCSNNFIEALVTTQPTTSPQFTFFGYLIYLYICIYKNRKVERGVEVRVGRGEVGCGLGGVEWR